MLSCDDDFTHPLNPFRFKIRAAPMRKIDWLRTFRFSDCMNRKTAARRRAEAVRRPSSQTIAGTERLESRILLTSDFGDAPDLGPGTGPGDYETLDSSGGPSHTVVAGLFLGATVDGDAGDLQNSRANADDLDAALPDDEDSVVNSPLKKLGYGARQTV
jgi:hypothetical protein